MSSPLKVAVVGVGSLGREHARIYAALAEAGVVELVGVFDTNPEQARTVAGRFRVPVLNDLAAAAAAAEALSIVTPTVTHFDIARDLLLQGKHLLVEKPMTETAEQAAELVAVAGEHDAVLQVGHVERFNPVFKYLTDVARQPRFIEAHRLSPFPGRSTDIGVVLDLMIHDLDVVLAFVNAPVQSVDGVGIAVLSRTEDIANARIKFTNGCVANLTASRVSAERMRKIRVFSAGEAPSYVSLDYREQKGYLYRLAREGEEESSLLKKLLRAGDSAIVSEFGGKRIVREPVPIQKDEPLKLELEHFVDCVRARQSPLVSGASAKLALDLALEITRQVQTAGLNQPVA
ncbi:MAG TPA: oxidoreductase [Verrucomicrobiales bacterium]|nr:oxidoreductase [Verrucomicrobiales bacterium]